jgi:hypothetical protein
LIDFNVFICCSTFYSLFKRTEVELRLERVHRSIVSSIIFSKASLYNKEEINAMVTFEREKRKTDFDRSVETDLWFLH